jgi:hypothetical protein
MTDIRKSLESLADAIEVIQNKKQPVHILDRELSGDKIHGGKITKFSSKGITDLATDTVLVVKNDGLHLDTIHVNRVSDSLDIGGALSVNGDITVNGAVTAKKLHVEELTADVRNERTEPLAFIGKDSKTTAYGKGLIWPGGDYTRQFMLMERPDRFFATESIELRAGKIYMINGQNVLSQDALGTTVVKSNLKKVGVLEKLEVENSLTVDNYLYYDPNTQRLGLGTESPNGSISILSWDHEFIIDPTDERRFKIGTYTTGGFDIITDDTPRISIEPTGPITIHNKVVIKDKLGIGVKNFLPDADITTSGPVRFEGKKFEVGESEPDSGNYTQGDIVWNSDPKPSGYIGWVCIRSGTPGTWKPFGHIAA